MQNHFFAFMLRNLVRMIDLDHKEEDQVNLWSKVIYNAHGIVVKFQATVKDDKTETSGTIIPHKHDFDELIYVCTGDYGWINRENGKEDAIFEFGDRLLRVPPETLHGGSTYGSWISIKPQEQVFSGINPNSYYNVFEYNGTQSLDVVTGTNLEEVNTSTLDLIVIPGFKKIVVLNSENVPKKLKGIEYVALRLTQA